ncbi:MAG: NADH-quinone oxidoreductase subunit NuoH [Deltaproteobacteria bacterium]|nr:NADH-quinone oxidoreductase subunit NuoH [Deltaproteobacteria bacterium]
MIHWLAGFVLLIIKLGIVLVALLLGAAYLVLAERKLLARMQIRIGPNRAGPFGLLQPIADLIKMMTKEDVIPWGADRVIFRYAPAVAAATAMLIFAVVPFGDSLTLWGNRIPLVITDLNVGLLAVLGLSSLGVYGVALGGWASNSKYSLLGAIRGVSQMISYELSLGLSLVPVVMLAGSFSLVDIVAAQKSTPFIFVQPVSFVIFFVSAMAEIKRIPFDLPEAENELIAGYHTEYSGLRFGLFFLGEYVTLVTLGALTAVFFLGGWHGPFFPGIIWLLIKIAAVAFGMIWVRGTLPRFRSDQLMDMGWKFLTPLALVNIVVTGAALLMLTTK